jgi:hypothetical protein
MKYNEIIALLDKGFTPEYIMNMGNDSENSDNSPEGDGSGQDPAEIRQKNRRTPAEMWPHRSRPRWLRS